MFQATRKTSQFLCVQTFLNLNLRRCFVKSIKFSSSRRLSDVLGKFSRDWFPNSEPVVLYYVAPKFLLAGCLNRNRLYFIFL